MIRIFTVGINLLLAMAFAVSFYLQYAFVNLEQYRTKSGYRDNIIRVRGVDAYVSDLESQLYIFSRGLIFVILVPAVVLMLRRGTRRRIDDKL
jgi:hypothetical protein